MKKSNRELFNDGRAEVCSTEGRSIKATLGKIRFGLRTVGINRFYQAKIADSSVDKLISVPMNPVVKGKGLLIIDGQQFLIEQIQEKYDTIPPSTYMSLKKAIPKYTDERIAHEKS